MLKNPWSGRSLILQVFILIISFSFHIQAKSFYANAVVQPQSLFIQMKPTSSNTDNFDGLEPDNFTTYGLEFGYFNQKSFQINVGYMMPTDVSINDNGTAVTLETSRIYLTFDYVRQLATASRFLFGGINVGLDNDIIKYGNTEANVSGIFLDLHAGVQYNFETLRFAWAINNVLMQGGTDKTIPPNGGGNVDMSLQSNWLVTLKVGYTF